MVTHAFCLPIRIHITIVTMLSTHQPAPNFSLPGIDDSEHQLFDLNECLSRDRIVLLVFYPFDFSPVCTTELCAIRDAEFFELTPKVEVWAVSADSTYSHEAFKEKHRLNFPLLSDFDASVAEQYGVKYDEWDDHPAVPKRAIFLIRPDQTIQYSWSTDNALRIPDFVPVNDALNELEAISGAPAPDSLDIEVNY